jgi:hypothetical protein
MTIEHWIRLFAGGVVLLSLGLGVEASPLFVSRHLLWLTAFVGANLLQSAFTGFCPLANVLWWAGVRQAAPAAPGSTPAV